MPQLWENYKRKEAECLSPAFMLIWLGGDVFGLIGGYLLGYSATVIATSIYFCVNDVFMLAQMFYYTKIYKGDRLPTATTTPTSAAKPVFAVMLLASGALSWATTGSSSASSSIGRTLLTTAENLCSPNVDIPKATFIAGSIISWVSGFLYFISRIPQVYHNYKNKSCEGLSIAMFVLAIFANTAFGFQFIAKRVIAAHRGNTMDVTEFVATDLPFIIGSLGTLVYDFIIVYQSRIYKKA